MWIDQPISHGIREWFSYSPQPKVARFHPYGKIKGMFKKHRQEDKQKALIQHHGHTRKYDEGFEMCDNGFNSLGSSNIFHGLRYREWVYKVWESYKLWVRKKEDSPDHPHPTLSLEKNDVLRQAYYKYARENGYHPESYRVLKTLYERHIKENIPQERKEIENDKTLSSYSWAIVQDAPRSKCLSMLNNERNPRSSCFFLKQWNKFVFRGVATCTHGTQVRTGKSRTHKKNSYKRIKK